MGLLSDIGDAIFGKEAEVQHRQDPTKTPEQLALLKQLIEMFQGQVAGAGGQVPDDLSSLERTSLAALEELAMQRTLGPDPTLEAARGAVQRGAQRDTVDIDEFNTFFKASVEDPMIRAFREEVMPELTRRFSGSAAFGSDRKQAEQQAVGRLGDSLASSRADLLFKTQQDTKNRALAAAGLAPSVSALTESGLNAEVLLQLLAGGSVPRTARQSNLDRALALLGLNPIENTTVVKPGSPGLLQSVAQGAGAAATKYFLG